MNPTFYFLSLISIGMLFFSSCSVKALKKHPERYLKETVIANRTLDGDYTLYFADKGLFKGGLFKEKKWTVYKGSHPQLIDWENPIAETKEDTIQFPKIAPKNQRLFFGVISPKGDKYIVSERRLALEGQSNFRDMGGIPTQDDRYISWGKLYRSGKLADLTEADLTYLKGLGLTTVSDLRNDVEIAEAPDRIPQNAKYFHIPIGDKEGAEYRRLKRRLIFGSMRKQKAKDEFIDIMKAFADSAALDFQPVLEQMFNEKRTPLVFHCSGGKDRTGFLAGLIYSALGVDRETVTNEYLMSNYYRYDLNKRLVKKARWLGLDAETMEYAFLVQQDYIDAVFELIEKEYETMDNYLLQKFGLTPEKRQILIDKFTYQLDSVKEEEQKEKEAKDSAAVEGPKIDQADEEVVDPE